MAVTVTKNTSWSSRLGGSVKNIFFGLLIFILAFPLIVWNEGRAVKTYKTLNEGSSVVVEGQAASISTALEGKLVHLTGPLSVGEEVFDDTFGVSEDVIALKRTVEMYQWVELSESTTKDKLGGGTETTTTYNYKKAWQETLNDSSGFAETEYHENPSEMRFESETFRNENVSLEAFGLAPELISQIDGYSSYPLTEENTLGLDFPEDGELYAGGFYIGYFPSDPEVGDLRVEFEVIEPGIVSVVAKQSGNNLTSYLADTGKGIALLASGEVSAEQMFAAAQQANKVMTWILRVLGVFMLYMGLYMMIGLLEVIADVVPFVGALVGVGLKLVSFLIALLLGFITIAISWFVFRPLLSIVLVAIAGAIGGGIYFLVQKNKK